MDRDFYKDPPRPPKHGCTSKKQAILDMKQRNMPRPNFWNGLLLNLQSYIQRKPGFSCFASSNRIRDLFNVIVAGFDKCNDNNHSTTRSEQLQDVSPDGGTLIELLALHVIRYILKVLLLYRYCSLPEFLPSGAWRTQQNAFLLLDNISVTNNPKHTHRMLIDCSILINQTLSRFCLKIREFITKEIYVGIGLINFDLVFRQISLHFSTTLQFHKDQISLDLFTRYENGSKSQTSTQLKIEHLPSPPPKEVACTLNGDCNAKAINSEITKSYLVNTATVLNTLERACHQNFIQTFDRTNNLDQEDSFLLIKGISNITSLKIKGRLLSLTPSILIQIQETLFLCENIQIDEPWLANLPNLVVPNKTFSFIDLTYRTIRFIKGAPRYVVIINHKTLLSLITSPSYSQALRTLDTKILTWSHFRDIDFPNSTAKYLSLGFQYQWFLSSFSTEPEYTISNSYQPIKLKALDQDIISNFKAATYKQDNIKLVNTNPIYAQFIVNSKQTNQVSGTTIENFTNTVLTDHMAYVIKPTTFHQQCFALHFVHNAMTLWAKLFSKRTSLHLPIYMDNFRSFIGTESCSQTRLGETLEKYKLRARWKRKKSRTITLLPYSDSSVNR
jgi:hypothetical protein